MNKLTMIMLATIASVIISQSANAQTTLGNTSVASLINFRQNNNPLASMENIVQAFDALNTQGMTMKLVSSDHKNAGKIAKAYFNNPAHANNILIIPTSSPDPANSNRIKKFSVIVGNGVTDNDMEIYFDLMDGIADLQERLSQGIQVLTPFGMSRPSQDKLGLATVVQNRNGTVYAITN